MQPVFSEGMMRAYQRHDPDGRSLDRNAANLARYRKACAAAAREAAQTQAGPGVQLLALVRTWRRAPA